MCATNTHIANERVRDWWSTSLELYPFNFIFMSPRKRRKRGSCVLNESSSQPASLNPLRWINQREMRLGRGVTWVFTEGRERGRLGWERASLIYFARLCSSLSPSPFLISFPPLGMSPQIKRNLLPHLLLLLLGPLWFHLLLLPLPPHAHSFHSHRLLNSLSFYPYVSLSWTLVYAAHTHTTHCLCVLFEPPCLSVFSFNPIFLFATEKPTEFRTSFTLLEPILSRFSLLPPNPFTLFIWTW